MKYIATVIHESQSTGGTGNKNAINFRGGVPKRFGPPAAGPRRAVIQARGFERYAELRDTKQADGNVDAVSLVSSWRTR